MHRLALAVAALAVLPACSGDDTTAGPRRTVDVVMTDIAFSPTTLAVAKGETVTFRFRNDGKLAHDAFVGDTAAQQEHEREMREDAGGHGHGDDAVTVEPGRTGELTYTFDRAGTVEVGCHQPGHYAAGMRITVTVT